LLVGLGIRAVEQGFSAQYFRFDELMTALRADACQRRREDASAGRSKNASRGLPSIALPNWLSCLIDVSLLSRPDLGTDGRGAQRRGWEERSHAHPGLDPGEHGEHRTFPAASTVAD